jgi:replicative DNA helicase
MNFTDTVKRNPGIVEIQVIAAFIGSRRFFLDHVDCINNHTSVVGKHKSKFSSYSNKLIFEAVVDIRDRIKEDLIPKSMVEDYMESNFQEGKLFDEEKEDMAKHLNEIYKRAEKTTVDFIEGDIFDAWFGSGLVTDIIDIVNTSENVLGVDELAQKLNRIQLAQNKRDNKAMSVMSSLQNDTDVGDVLPSGIPKLDHHLGGGFRCGESSLVAASTGGGKTVFACQLAGQFATMGRKTIFVTTEQHPRELTPRFIANHCGIPFSSFTEHTGGNLTIPESLMSDREYGVKILNTLNILDENIKYVDWSGGDGMSIEKDLDLAIEAIMEDPENPFPAEVVIFDWLGGALKKDANKDLRIMFLDGAEHLHNMAKRRKISLIFFAQLNKVKSRDKARCDSSMLAECTALPDKASNAIYISSKRSEEDDRTFSLSQKFNVDKARKGPGGMLEVIRDFAHQRFLSPAMINSL